MLLFREDLRPSDREAVRAVVSATGMFRPNEIDVVRLLQQQRPDNVSVLAQELMKGVHTPCDLVGNIGSRLLQDLTSTTFPGWIDLVVGQVIGATCGEVFG